MKAQIRSAVRWIESNKIKAGAIVLLGFAIPGGLIEVAGDKALQTKISSYPPAQQNALRLAVVRQIDQLPILERITVKANLATGSDPFFDRMIPAIADTHQQFCTSGRNGLAQAIGLNVLNSQIEGRTDLDGMTRKFMKTAIAVSLTAPCEVAEAPKAEPVASPVPVASPEPAPVKPAPVSSVEREEFQPSQEQRSSVPNFPGVVSIKPRSVMVIDPPSNLRAEPSMSGKILTQFEGGRSIVVSAQIETASGMWFYTYGMKHAGWIHSTQVSMSNISSILINK